MTDDNVLVKGKRYDGLRVRSAFGSDVIHLSSVISRPHIHIDPCLIPTPDTVKLLGHLQRIATELMPLLNCPEGLLIGYDHAEALMPVEVIQGTPFAICTVLGWSVIGRPADDATCDVMGSTYHTIAPTDTGHQKAQRQVDPRDEKIDDDIHLFGDQVVLIVPRNYPGHLLHDAPFRDKAQTNTGGVPSQPR
ncbi:hypothetical protein ACOMHN_029198 [Nucella lapillus]